MSKNQVKNSNFDTEYSEIFNYVRSYYEPEKNKSGKNSTKITDFSDLLEAKLALAAIGAGEKDGWSWEPTCAGEGVNFTFPKSLGDCSGEVVRLQKGVYLITRIHNPVEPLMLSLSEQGLYFAFVCRGCINLSISDHGSTTVQGPAGVNVLFPSQSNIQVALTPGAPLELVTVFFQNANYLHDFGIPKTWYPNQIIKWLRLPKQNLGFSLSYPSGESIATARQIMSCEFTGPLRMLYLAAKCRELVCHLIASRVLANNFMAARSLRRMPNDRIEEVVKFLIESDLSQEWNINTLAAHLSVSRNKLMRVFKEQNNETIHSFHQRKRMERARELLLNTSQSITEIALALGYSRLNNFSDTFRSVHNCSASEFRKHSQQ